MSFWDALPPPPGDNSGWDALPPPPDTSGWDALPPPPDTSGWDNLPPPPDTSYNPGYYPTYDTATPASYYPATNGDRWYNEPQQPAPVDPLTLLQQGINRMAGTANGWQGPMAPSYYGIDENAPSFQSQQTANYDFMNQPWFNQTGQLFATGEKPYQRGEDFYKSLGLSQPLYDYGDVYTQAADQQAINYDKSNPFTWWDALNAPVKGALDVAGTVMSQPGKAVDYLADQNIPVVSGVAQGARGLWENTVDPVMSFTNAAVGDIARGQIPTELSNIYREVFDRDNLQKEYQQKKLTYVQDAYNQAIQSGMSDADASKIAQRLDDKLGNFANLTQYEGLQKFGTLPALAQLGVMLTDPVGNTAGNLLFAGKLHGVARDTAGKAVNPVIRGVETAGQLAPIPLAGKAAGAIADVTGLSDLGQAVAEKLQSPQQKVNALMPEVKGLLGDADQGTAGALQQYADLTQTPLHGPGGVLDQFINDQQFRADAFGYTGKLEKTGNDIAQALGDIVNESQLRGIPDASPVTLTPEAQTAMAANAGPTFKAETPAAATAFDDKLAAYKREFEKQQYYDLIHSMPDGVGDFDAIRSGQVRDTPASIQAGINAADKFNDIKTPQDLANFERENPAIVNRAEVTPRTKNYDMTGQAELDAQLNAEFNGNQKLERYKQNRPAYMEGLKVPKEIGGLEARDLSGLLEKTLKLQKGAAKLDEFGKYYELKPLEQYGKAGKVARGPGFMTAYMARAYLDNPRRVITDSAPNVIKTRLSGYSLLGKAKRAQEFEQLGGYLPDRSGGMSKDLLSGPSKSNKLMDLGYFALNPVNESINMGLNLLQKATGKQVRRAGQLVEANENGLWRNIGQEQYIRTMHAKAKEAATQLAGDLKLAPERIPEIQKYIEQGNLTPDSLAQFVAGMLPQGNFAAKLDGKYWFGNHSPEVVEAADSLRSTPFSGVTVPFDDIGNKLDEANAARNKAYNRGVKKPVDAGGDTLANITPDHPLFKEAEKQAREAVASTYTTLTEIERAQIMKAKADPFVEELVNSVTRNEALGWLKEYISREQDKRANYYTDKYGVREPEPTSQAKELPPARQLSDKEITVRETSRKTSDEEFGDWHAAKTEVMPDPQLKRGGNQFNSDYRATVTAGKAEGEPGRLETIWKATDSEGNTLAENVTYQEALKAAKSAVKEKVQLHETGRQVPPEVQARLKAAGDKAVADYKAQYKIQQDNKGKWQVVDTHTGKAVYKSDAKTGASRFVNKAVEGERARGENIERGKITEEGGYRQQEAPEPPNEFEEVARKAAEGDEGAQRLLDHMLNEETANLPDYKGFYDAIYGPDNPTVSPQSLRSMAKSFGSKDRATRRQYLSDFGAADEYIRQTTNNTFKLDPETFEPVRISDGRSLRELRGGKDTGPTPVEAVKPQDMENYGNDFERVKKVLGESAEKPFADMSKIEQMHVYSKIAQELGFPDPVDPYTTRGMLDMQRQAALDYIDSLKSDAANRYKTASAAKQQIAAEQANKQKAIDEMVKLTADARTRARLEATRAAKKAADSVLFDYGNKNLVDQAMSNWLPFNYWARQNFAYIAKHFATHPYHLVAVLNFYNKLDEENQKAGIPQYARSYLHLWDNPDGSKVMWNFGALNPLNFGDSDSYMKLIDAGETDSTATANKNPLAILFGSDTRDSKGNVIGREKGLIPSFFRPNPLIDTPAKMGAFNELYKALGWTPKDSEFGMAGPKNQQTLGLVAGRGLVESLGAATGATKALRDAGLPIQSLDLEGPVNELLFGKNAGKSVPRLTQALTLMAQRGDISQDQALKALAGIKSGNWTPEALKALDYVDAEGLPSKLLSTSGFSVTVLNTPKEQLAKKIQGAYGEAAPDKGHYEEQPVLDEQGNPTGKTKTVYVQGASSDFFNKNPGASVLFSKNKSAEEINQGLADNQTYSKMQDLYKQLDAKQISSAKFNTQMDALKEQNPGFFEAQNWTKLKKALGLAPLKPGEKRPTLDSLNPATLAKNRDYFEKLDEFKQIGGDAFDQKQKEISALLDSGDPAKEKQGYALQKDRDYQQALAAREEFKKRYPDFAQQYDAFNEKTYGTKPKSEEDKIYSEQKQGYYDAGGDTYERLQSMVSNYFDQGNKDAAYAIMNSRDYKQAQGARELYMKNNPDFAARYAQEYEQKYGKPMASEADNAYKEQLNNYNQIGGAKYDALAAMVSSYMEKGDKKTAGVILNSAEYKQAKAARQQFLDDNPDFAKRYKAETEAKYGPQPEPKTTTSANGNSANYTYSGSNTGRTTSSKASYSPAYRAASYTPKSTKSYSYSPVQGSSGTTAKGTVSSAKTSTSKTIAKTVYNTSSSTQKNNALTVEQRLAKYANRSAKGFQVLRAPKAAKSKSVSTYVKRAAKPPKVTTIGKKLKVYGGTI